MTPPANLSERIVDLEIKFSFIEEHAVQQDREMLKMRTQLEKLQEEIERLRAAGNGSEMGIRGDEKPPHY